MSFSLSRKLWPMRFPVTPWIAALIVLFWTLPQQAQSQNRLANTTVLVIRHAEKPASGSSLTPEGFARADKYAHYFNPLHLNGETIRINALYAGADSAGSVRPRLTLRPLSHATGIPLNTQFRTDQPEALVHALSTEPHGDHILIAWRHKKIPALLEAFGANPDKLLPDGIWPDSVVDWIILLRYDAKGQLETQELLHEPEPLP